MERSGAAAQEAIALAVALQPMGPGRPWHAALVLASGERREFDSLTAFVQYLVGLSLPQPPPGLR